MSKPKSSYEVGYGKPPKETQFVKGKSGNPKGRSKGSRNLAAFTLEVARRPLLMNTSRGVRKVPLALAMMMQMGNKAAQGDLRAAREFASWIQWSEESANANAAPLAHKEMSKQVWQTMLRRMGVVTGEPTVANNHGSPEESE